MYFLIMAVNKGRGIGNEDEKKVSKIKKNQLHKIWPKKFEEKGENEPFFFLRNLEWIFKDQFPVSSNVKHLEMPQHLMVSRSFHIHLILTRQKQHIYKAHHNHYDKHYHS